MMMMMMMNKILNSIISSTDGTYSIDGPNLMHRTIGLTDEGTIGLRLKLRLVLWVRYSPLVPFVRESDALLSVSAV